MLKRIKTFNECRTINYINCICLKLFIEIPLKRIIIKFIRSARFCTTKNGNGERSLMKKWKLGLTTALAAMLVLAGCNNNADENKDPANEPSAPEEKTSYTIGISQLVEHASLDEATRGFEEAIADSGLDVTFDKQSAQGDQNNATTIAQGFVSKKVDLIFANATQAAQAAVTASKDIPVVFTSVTDPVDASLVDSMEKPGGIATGTADGHPDAIPNTMKFINDMGFKAVGTVYNAGEANSVIQVDIMKAEAAKYGITVVEQAVATSADVKQATEGLIGKVDSIYIITDNTVVSALQTVIQTSIEKKLPLFVGELDSVKNGGFAAYGFSYYDIGYEAGKMAVQILKDGKTPAEIPALYPPNLALYINKTAAAEMGVEINEADWPDAQYID